MSNVTDEQAARALRGLLALAVVLAGAVPCSAAEAAERARLVVVDEHRGPVIGRGSGGTEGNAAGFETGQVLKLNGAYRMFVNEMFGRPHQDMRVAHWTSRDATMWERRGAVIESIPGRSPLNLRTQDEEPAEVKRPAFRGVGKVRVRLAASAATPAAAPPTTVASVAIPRKEQVGATQLPDAIEPVKAPFPMPQFRKPTFPALSIDITERGAKQRTKATAPIQAAIDEVSQRGGGTVVVPRGEWHSGRISLKSNVNLRIEEGAELLFSGEVEDYRPAVFTRNEGVEVMSLGACIYANGQENIAITGKGKLIGPAKGGSVRTQVMNADVVEKFISHTTPVSERVYEGHDGGFVFLPMFISPIDCKNVYIEGVTLENTAFWNIVPIYCDGVIIRGVTVNSVGIPRGDGIDIESSRNVLIEYSTLNCGDDCFTMKAGRGEDGLRVNRPTENVVVRYCLAREGHGAITCGSETAGMIRNLYVHDCVFDNTGSGVRFKTRRPRGGGGENLIYERLRMNLTGTAFTWDMLGSATYVGDLAKRLPPREINRLTPAYRNIVARNIIVENASQFVKITGIPESPLTNVLIEHADVKAKKLISAADTKTFALRHARVHSDDAQMTLLDCRDVTFEDVHFSVPGSEVVTNVAGELSSSIRFVNCKPEKPKGWQGTTWGSDAAVIE